MTASILFSKKKKTDEKGYLFILYREGAQKKKVSLEYSMTRDNFDLYWNPNFKQLTPNKKFDFTAVNIKIAERFSENPFEVKKKPKKHFTFLEYFRYRKNLKDNFSTINTYSSAERMLELYLESIGQSDIEFEEIDNDFPTNMHKFCAKEGLQNSTIRFYCQVYAAIFNAAFENEVYIGKNPFSKGKPLVSPKPKTILSDDDVLKILEIKSNQSYFLESRMFLFAMFGNGMRSSDMMLMKFGSIKREYLEYHQQKTEEPMKINYSEKVILVLMDIFGLMGKRVKIERDSKIQIQLKDKVEFIPYREARRMMLDRIAFNEVDKDYENYFGYKIKSTDLFSKTVIDELRRVQRNINAECKVIIYKYVIQQNPKDLVFAEFMKTDLFADYDNKFALVMNEDQFKTYKSRYTAYNAKLKRLAKIYKLGVENMTTHVARYTLTNILLDMGMNVNDIRVALGHKSLSTTGKYIAKGFNFKKSDVLSDEFSSRFVERL